MRLSSAFDRYAVTITPHKKGADNERYLMRKLVGHPLANKPLSDIKRRDVVALRDEMVSSGLAPSTIRSYLYLLSNLFRVAADEWDMDVVNPVAGLRMPKNRPHRTRKLSIQEERRLLAACSPRIRSIVIWAIYTGMRRGELLKIDRKDVQGSTVLIRDSKNGEPRTAPLPKEAQQQLPHLPRDGKLFPISTDTLRWFSTKACREARIDDLRFHDCRRTFVSRALEKNLSHFAVMQAVGHRSTIMLKRYASFDMQSIAKQL